jgi:two-component system NtrC family response regulator
MQEIFEIIGKVSKGDKTVLIEGESGTGKGLIAKTIHYNSFRKEKPLIVVNCGALTESLLISELFGHTKGSFTGAVTDKIGRFQMADGGTLVLDEIGEFPFHLQKTLLKVIEEKDFLRIGDNKYTTVDVRIISTTNRNLKEEVEKGNFREDLYYRLGIIPITIPPLRERLSDIPLLVKHYLKNSQEEGVSVRIEPEVLQNLQTYSWPGNIRELNNIVQQMMIFCSGNTITMDDLPPSLFLREGGSQRGKSGKIQLTKMVGELERKFILAKLKESDWNQEKAAKSLGITRKMLRNRMIKYRLNPSENKLVRP